MRLGKTHSVYVALAAIWVASCMSPGPAGAVEPNCEFPCTPGPATDVHLEWRPALTQNVVIGDTVDVALFAVRDLSGVPIRTQGIEMVLAWDPQKLELLGNVNDGPYAWFSSQFPNDAGIDNLNNGLFAPPVGVPANDGLAFYAALGQLPPPLGDGPALIPVGGLHVTTFQFKALASSPASVISIPVSAGLFTCTVVFWGEVPGCGMTGMLGTASVQIEPVLPIPGDGDNDGDVDLDDYALFVACAGLPGVSPECVPFDLDRDIDVDLIDWAWFQTVLGR